MLVSQLVSVDRVVMLGRCGRPVCLTRPARNATAQEAISALRRRHPGPVHPGRIVAHVPLVPTRQVRHPVALVVAVIARNFPFHAVSETSSCALTSLISTPARAFDTGHSSLAASAIS